MRKFAVISLAVIALLALQISADDSDDGKASDTGTKQGRFVQPVQTGRVAGTGRHYAPPRNNLSRIIRILILYQVFQGLFTTTNAPETTTTTVTTVTTAEITTADPCLSWPTAHSCRYQIFSETVTWNQAKSRCSSMCSSKLAHQNIRTAATLNAVLGVITYDNAPMWIGLSDADSFDGVDPKWDETTDETTITFDATRYATLVGTPGCGYYSVPQDLTLYRFERCSSTNALTATRFLCEACP